MNEYKWANDLAFFNKRAKFHETFVNYIIRNCGVEENYNVIDVGCGYGDTMVKLQEFRPSISITLVEPTTSVEVAKNKMSSNKDLIKIYNEKIEDLLVGNMLNKVYNLIFFSHTIYYIKDILSCITGLRKLLVESGELIIVVRSSEGFDYQLRRILGDLLNEKKIFYESSHLEETLKQSRINYSKTSLDYQINIDQPEWENFISDNNCANESRNIFCSLLRLISHKETYHWTQDQFQKICLFISENLVRSGSTLKFKDHIFHLKR